MFRLQREIKHIVGMRLSYSGLKQPMWKLHSCYRVYLFSQPCGFELKGDFTHVLLCIMDVYLHERL